MRLINADALDFGFPLTDDLNGMLKQIGVEMAKTRVMNAPTINPDVLRPHGRWVTHDNGITECSECHTLGSPQWKCCPVCTAMMDGKENEDA